MTLPPDAAAGDGSPDRLRRRIAHQAARAVAAGSDAKHAVFRAARRLTRGWVPDDELPDAEQVRAEVHRAIDPTGSLQHLGGDRFDRIAALVAVLETVRQDPERHPEGDVLEHSLQVLDLVHQERPFDEELLTAALVHDIGLAIDRGAAASAARMALGDLVTPRTHWLIESLDAARAHGAGTLGARARRRLEGHPDFLDAQLLAQADRRGRVRGYDAPSLEQAIAILRDLEQAADSGDAAAWDS